MVRVVVKDIFFERNVVSGPTKDFDPITYENQSQFWNFALKHFSRLLLLICKLFLSIRGTNLMLFVVTTIGYVNILS